MYLRFTKFEILYHIIVAICYLIWNNYLALNLFFFSVGTRKKPIISAICNMYPLACNNKEFFCNESRWKNQLKASELIGSCIIWVYRKSIGKCMIKMQWKITIGLVVALSGVNAFLRGWTRISLGLELVFMALGRIKCKVNVETNSIV